MEATVAPETDLAQFAQALDKLVRAVGRARFAMAGEDELSPSQFSLLLPLLDESEPPGLRELAAAVGVSPPTATRMLDGLQARGLVTRERSERDRRAVCLALTHEGARQVRERRDATLALRRTMFERLNPEERRAAASVLGRLAEVLDGNGDR